VYNFPWQTALLMRMTRWLPDWMIAKFVLNKTEGRPSPGREGTTKHTAPPTRNPNFTTDFTDNTDGKRWTFIRVIREIRG